MQPESNRCIFAMAERESGYRVSSIWHYVMKTPMIARPAKNHSRTYMTSIWETMLDITTDANDYDVHKPQKLQTHMRQEKMRQEKNATYHKNAMRSLASERMVMA
jgi:hypothetical protein